MYLIFDTETTGFPSDSLPPDHPSQAQICQLGAQLVAVNQRVVGELNLLIKRDGWSIPAKVSEIHGISDAMCDQYGVPLREALIMFARFYEKADLLVAHNFPFDYRMITLAMTKLQFSCNEFKAMKNYCTMNNTTELLKIPSSRGGYKWPKLTETYQFFFKEPLLCAHDAMADVRGCARVYFHITSPTFGLASQPWQTDAAKTIENIGL